MNVLITGGSRGIGAAAVRAFSARGDRVAFFYEKEDEKAAAVAAGASRRYESWGGGALAWLRGGWEYIHSWFAQTSAVPSFDVDSAALDAMRPSEAEVADTFLVPLQWLRDHPPAVYAHRQPMDVPDFPYGEVGVSADYPWRAYYMEVPVYHGLPHPLWGLTARITMDVVAHL